MTRQWLSILLMTLAACAPGTSVDDAQTDSVADTAGDDTGTEALSCGTPFSQSPAMTGDVFNGAAEAIAFVWLEDRCSAELHVFNPLDLSNHPSPVIRLDRGDQILVSAAVEPRLYDDEVIFVSWDPAEHDAVPFDDESSLILLVVDTEDLMLPSWSSEVLGPV